METKRKGGRFAAKSVFRLTLVTIVIVAIVLHMSAPEKHAKIFARVSSDIGYATEGAFFGIEDTVPVDYKVEVGGKAYVFRDITKPEADCIYERLYAVGTRTRALVKAAQKFGFFGQIDDSEEIDDLVSQYNSLTRIERWHIYDRTLYAVAVKELGGKRERLFEKW